MRSHGFTLLELLIGVFLFSLVLGMTALGLEVSQKTLLKAENQVPVQSSLQNAMDEITRLIRESKNVSGGGTTLVLTQWDNRVENVVFSNGILFANNIPLQGGLSQVQFVVNQGEAVKWVEIALAASGKALVSSASLRNVPSGNFASASPTRFLRPILHGPIPASNFYLLTPSFRNLLVPVSSPHNNSPSTLNPPIPTP
jgi:prepilin-type N-terminal cleavage/methylation domain-containing protein